MHSAPAPDGTPRCFDESRATSATRIVPVAAVVDLLHVTHAPERIATYRAAMQRGDCFPPIAVVCIAGRLFIADGHKRFSAYRSFGTADIVVEVWPLRRWLKDQRRQAVHKTRQQWRIIRRSAVDPQARAQAVRLFWDTLGHWKRIGASLARVGTRARSQ